MSTEAPLRMRPTEKVTPPAEHTTLELDDEGNQRVSHYIVGKGDISGPDLWALALIEGFPVTSLCGKTFVPTRDPKKYPICPECVELAASRIEAEG